VTRRAPDGAASIRPLLENNRQWARGMLRSRPDFFERLVQVQSPRYLWIGCADSRVPANEIVGLAAGELFVHRNVANLVVHTDINCLSVLQYAVDVLKVRHVIVCGHYGCGAVKAALEDSAHGLIDNWLGHLRDIARIHRNELAGLRGAAARVERLCELNIREQAANVAATTVVQEARARGQELHIHPWIYDLRDGLLRPLPPLRPSDLKR
jgi:carbonic anhydrase